MEKHVLACASVDESKTLIREPLDFSLSHTVRLFPLAAVAHAELFSLAPWQSAFIPCQDAPRWLNSDISFSPLFSPLLPRQHLA